MARPIVKGLQRSFAAVGFELRDNRPAQLIPDAEYYRPMFQPWLTPTWRKKLRADDPRSLLSLEAKYMLYSLAKDASYRCDGSFAECGVYKGGTAKLLLELASNRSLYLFDTFEGMPEVDPTRDLHAPGDFADTNLASVTEYLAPRANVTLVPGLIPASLKVARDQSFAFVHIDLDIYHAIKSACEFFYERMQPGGIMLFDDYGYPSCPGARAAVEEFFAGKHESPLAIATGQAFVIRCR